jgi:hypothetical protein
LERIVIDQYNLGAKFCRKNLKDGGVSISVHGSLDFTNIKLFVERNINYRHSNCKKKGND